MKKSPLGGKFQRLPGKFDDILKLKGALRLHHIKRSPTFMKVKEKSLWF